MKCVHTIHVAFSIIVVLLVTAFILLFYSECYKMCVCVSDMQQRRTHGGYDVNKMRVEGFWNITRAATTTTNKRLCVAVR